MGMIDVERRNVQEKTIAARRAGCKTLVFPEANRWDLGGLHMSDAQGRMFFQEHNGKNTEPTDQIVKLESMFGLSRLAHSAQGRDYDELPKYLQDGLTVPSLSPDPLTEKKHILLLDRGNCGFIGFNSCTCASALFFC